MQLHILPKKQLCVLLISTNLFHYSFIFINVGADVDGAATSGVRTTLPAGFPALPPPCACAIYLVREDTVALLYCSRTAKCNGLHIKYKSLVVPKCLVFYCQPRSIRKASRKQVMGPGIAEKVK